MTLLDKYLIIIKNLKSLKSIMQDLPIDDAIVKYKIPLTSDPVNQEEFEKCKFVLIRHALSEFNFRALVAKQDFGETSPEHRAVETSTELTDPELHAVGVK